MAALFCAANATPFAQKEGSLSCLTLTLLPFHPNGRGALCGITYLFIPVGTGALLCCKSAPP
ncbi:hypothetical protein PLUA15_230158 [Pseudomonas lundensis]|uniref:Lipoprotein n=1 Tax=Pseudomonas lundensis TaxID=86185 RepID=A0AAX2H7Y1_9PSED|nr:hypothetical protein PLUA15_230158 [Pseudomonas lundensis]